MENTDIIGLDKLKKILGQEALLVLDKLKDISPDFAQYLVNFCYGEIYTRQCLKDKTKELAAVTSLVTQGNFGLPLSSHIRGMLNVGWRKEEIFELFIFLAGYMGFPKALEGTIVAEKVISSSLTS